MKPLLAALLFLVACGSQPPSQQEPEADAGEVEDAGATQDGGSESDAGELDAGQEVDAGPQPSSPVRINEIYVGRVGEGDNVEFVELRGPAGQPLYELGLRLIGPDGGVRYDLAVTRSDAGVNPDGTFVVGGSLASNVDETYSIATWGLDGSKGAVQLVKRGATPELIDVLGYGGEVGPASSEPFATSEGTPVMLPTQTGRSLGRVEGAADTNDNTADFCQQNASPGDLNDPCL